VIDVAGNARERGRAHGEALREQIERGLALWREHAGPVAGADHYLAAARRWTPAAVEELEGIAEGAGVPFDALLAYNLGDELRVFGALERCTSAGLRRGSLGVPVSGQTMDTPPWFAEFRVAIRSAEQESGLTTLSFTIAGLLGLCGVNSAGVGVWCNALYQLPSSTGGVPVSFVVRHLLSQPSLADATAFVRSVPHASGQHYLLVGPDGLVSLECSGTHVVESQPGTEAIWHTNHPLSAIDRSDEPDGRSSLDRAAFAKHAVERAHSPADLRQLFSDRTVPVAKSSGAGGDGYTLWGVVVEHAVPPRVLASAGPPDASAWQPVAFVP
jgi:isopenicillin-N N-acyltransferase-like protein